MQTTTLHIESADGLDVHTYRWAPDGPVTGTVQIAHGMGEHSARYARLADALTGAGWTVYANDHRGHGRTAAGVPGAGPLDGLGEFGDAGWDGLVDDVVALNRRVGADQPGVAHILLGHSMGSFAAQQFALDHSREIDGLVLSGTTAVDLAVATLEPDGDAPADLTGLNAGFEPARTPFDWLSRDEAEVDKYLADDWCGFGIDAAASRSLVKAGPRFGDPAALAAIRPDLPLYVIAGSRDPLNFELSLVELVVQRYRDAGLTDITTDFYEGARHEVFNETNRDEVTANLLAWLDRFR